MISSICLQSLFSSPCCWSLQEIPPSFAPERLYPYKRFVPLAVKANKLSSSCKATWVGGVRWKLCITLGKNTWDWKTDGRSTCGILPGARVWQSNVPSLKKAVARSHLKKEVCSSYSCQPIHLRPYEHHGLLLALCILEGRWFSCRHWLGKHVARSVAVSRLKGLDRLQLQWHFAGTAVSTSVQQCFNNEKWALKKQPGQRIGAKEVLTLGVRGIVNDCYGGGGYVEAQGLPVTVLYWRCVCAQSVFKGLSLVECF